MPEILLSLGSNIEPRRHLQAAVSALRAAKALKGGRLSTLYRSPAVGFKGPDFINGAYYAQCSTSLPRLQELLRAIEDHAGRVRGVQRFSSRTLDIDLVLFGDETHADGSGVPRAELLEQAFVLRPCAELAPDWVHPISGWTLAAHWAQWRTAHADPLKSVADLTRDLRAAEGCNASC